MQSLWCELVLRRGLRWQGELVARGWISRPLSWSSAFQVIFIALLYVECQCSETCVAIGCRQTSQSHGADALYHFDLFCTGSCFQLRVGTSLGFIAKRSGTCAAKGWTVFNLRLRGFTGQARWAILSICRVAVHSMAKGRCLRLDESRVVSRTCKVVCRSCHWTYVG